MTNPISGMSFQPGHGGGGGMFYMGRQEQPEDEDERDEEEGAPSSALQGDQMTLEAPRRSGLSLPEPDDEEAPAEDWESTSVEIKNSLRYMNLAVAHLERDFARRQHSEIGSVTITTRVPKPQPPNGPSQ